MARAHLDRKQWLSTVVMMLVLAVVTACTADPPEEPAPTPPSPSQTPRNAFSALEGRAETGARVFTSALAGVDDRVVSVGLYWDGAASATFGWSDDGGQTWQAGQAPAPEKPVSEQADYVSVRTQTGTATWLALGSSGESYARWTSVDGVTWERALIDRAMIDQSADRVVDLTSTDRGFAASGYTSDDRGKDYPRVWTSTDGVSWAKHRLPGTGTVSGLAARGRTWVAVGSTDDDWLVWRSVDAGARWSRVTKIPRVDDDSGFNRSFNDVVRHGDGFVAIGAYHSDNLVDDSSGYQPMVYRSADGKTWRPDPTSAALGQKGDSSGHSLASQGGEMTAVVNLNRTMDRQEVWRWTNGAWWPMYDPRATDDRAVSWVERPVRTSAGWVSAANRTLNNSITTAVWRAEPGSVFFKAVPSPPPPRTTAVTAPAELVRWAGSWRVAGETRDRRGLWTQASDGTVGPPQQTTLPDSARLAGLAAHDKTLLAYGQTSGGNSDFATVWRSSDGKTFTPTGRHTFQKVGRYTYSSINGLHRFGSTWFAVGERSVNGDANVSALVATSNDGKTWRAGKPARILTKSKGDEVWYDVTDLDGDHDRRRSMSDITRTSRDYLAAGWSEENGPKQATVWHSGDGRTWRSSVIGARGFARSGLSGATSIGDRTVLSGWVGRRGQTKTLPYVWSSGDGGKSWSGRVVGRLGDTAEELVATDTHFVLASSVEGDISHPVVQQSVDGTTWAPVALTGFDATPAEDVWVSDLRADGRDIVALVRVANRVGAGSVLIRQRVS